jgi:hypothetical protein
MQYKDLPEEQICNLCCTVVYGNGEEMRKLSQPVYYHENAIFALSLGKTCDEIHRYAFPFVLWNGKWL